MYRRRGFDSLGGNQDETKSPAGKKIIIPIKIAHLKLRSYYMFALFCLHKIRVLCRKDFLTEENESVVLKDRFFLLPL